MDIIEYFNLCKNFDWFYSMSDDYRVWCRGHESEDRLIRESRKSPCHTAIFNVWRDYNFSGDDFGTEKKPKPCLVDFLEDADEYLRHL